MYFNLNRPQGLKKCDSTHDDEKLQERGGADCAAKNKSEQQSSNQTISCGNERCDASTSTVRRLRRPDDDEGADSLPEARVSSCRHKKSVGIVGRLKKATVGRLRPSKERVKERQPTKKQSFDDLALSPSKIGTFSSKSIHYDEVEEMKQPAKSKDPFLDQSAGLHGTSTRAAAHGMKTSGQNEDDERHLSSRESMKSSYSSISNDSKASLPASHFLQLDERACGRGDEYNDCFSYHDNITSLADLRRVMAQEQEDARLAQALAFQEKLASEAVMRQHRSHEDQMRQSLSGRAWQFLEHVQTKMQEQGESELKLVSMDSMMEQTENLLSTQLQFQISEKEGLIVDIGYHYTRRENLPLIEKHGLLSKAERDFHSVAPCHEHGSFYGDGIYTANNPFKFHGRYGDMGILVARLRGKCSFALKKTIDTVGTDAHPDEHPDADTTIVVGRHDTNVEFSQRVILKRSTQCITLCTFPADMIHVGSNEEVAARNHQSIQNAHKLLQELLDEFVNKEITIAPPAQSPYYNTSFMEENWAFVDDSSEELDLNNSHEG